MSKVSISEIQGEGLYSPLADQYVTTQGVVTGVVRRGFFLQSLNANSNPLVSDGIFVFSPKWRATAGVLMKVTGKVFDYVREENGKPVTQIKFKNYKLIDKYPAQIEPVELTADNVPSDPAELAIFLNSLEGMLVSIAAGHTFISPSNPYGDYVLTLDAEKHEPNMIRTEHGGALIDHQNPLRWYPGFRITDYNNAPRLNVGSKLKSRVVGPLNYRVEAFQIAARGPIDIEPSFIPLTKSKLKPEAGYLTILTLNGFNLDMCVESEDKVINPMQDIDDDWGDGRFHTLAQAVVLQANTPDIIALQEIQDNDGAEVTDVVRAGSTYQGLIDTIKQLCDVEYRWVDISPEVGADGGQPGGNIRNGYLYNPQAVELVKDSMYLIGEDEVAFVDSRKPLVAGFKDKVTNKELVCINVHLASKRHQRSIFAPQQPGVDGKLPVRIKQAKIIRQKLIELHQQGSQYYVTGDFNDTETSQTLDVLVGEGTVNLVNTLPVEQRYDYNHRGKLQVLMHGIIQTSLADRGAGYEVIHGNELLGVQPGNLGDKPTDHAYVIAKLSME